MHQVLAWLVWLCLATTMTCGAATTIISDSYNVTAAGAGFALGQGVNSGINPPATRLRGAFAAGLRYIHTGTKATDAYTIADNKLQVTSATNQGRIVLSGNGTTSWDFGPALGVPSATPSAPVQYDISVRMNNNSYSNQRFSIALSTADGDVDTWSFGFQVYRASASDDFYTIHKRVDTSSSGVSADLNKPITTLSGGTFGGDIIVLLRVTDAGAQSAGFNSRVQVSLNNGNSWNYDTASDPDLPNGWRINGPGRHIIWQMAGTAGPVTYDDFSVVLNPSTNSVNTGPVFRAMTYNIHYGTKGGKVNTQNTANYILDQKIDLVSLNEVDRFKARSDNRDLITELARATGYGYVYANNIIDPVGNDQMGNAILSKYPIIAWEHLLLPRIGDNEQRALLKSVVDIGGKFVAFWSTHLDFHADESERLQSVAALNTWVSEGTLPVVMGGDFNDSPGSNPCTQLAQKWNDVWLLAGDGTLGRTSPCPPPLNVRIDYLWAVKSANLSPRNAFVGYTHEASDHYPVISQFEMKDFGAYAPGFYFPLNEGAGAKATDTIAGLSAAIGSGGPVWSGGSPTGIPGDASLFFDGTRRLTVPDPKQLISTNGANDDYTLQAWVKVAVNYAPPKRAILFQYERRPGFSLSINTNRTLHTTTFRIKDISSSAALPNDGAWHHVAVVHVDGAAMRFYIDGVLASTVSYKNGAGQRTSSVITVGADAEGANPFTGYLDRIRFDNRALAPTEFDLALRPEFYPPRLSAGELRFSGTGGLPGKAYRLLSSTNASAPPEQWLPVQSNVFGTAGHFSNAVPASDQTIVRFYRIAVP